MKPIPTLALAVSLCTSSCAFAQTPPEGRLGPDLQGQVLGGPMRHDLLFVAGAQLEQERIVQGAPYCADAVHESVQALADGNRIVQRQASRQCRDGQGRTRQEVTTRGGGTRVFLRDPVAKENWVLDPERRLAVKLDLPRQPLAIPDPKFTDRMREWGEQFRQWGERFKDKLKLGGGDVPPPPEMPHMPEPPRIALHAPHLDGMPPPVAFHARLIGPRGPGATTLLPADTVEGLRADGKRTTWTIEAGRIGNEKPITIINEVWSSPELGITLRTRDVDPMAGEDSFRVQNVARGEPDAQLFRVPADYARMASPPGPFVMRKPLRPGE
ncbi:hypothetical protein [Ramlibacter sp. PS4R-6]|uniref:hypothetical protein n=1 Tax=Ramlibacter sp. PS4R-6 TaxID=3133438 RepID=UPI0030A1D656